MLVAACLSRWHRGAGRGRRARARTTSTIDLDPAGHRLRVTDRSSSCRREREHGHRVPAQRRAGDPRQRARGPARCPLGDVADFFGINAGASTPDERFALARYRVAGPPGGGVAGADLRGSDRLRPLGRQKEEYTRGFRETAGVIGAEGVYLAGNGFWYPHFGDGLVEFAHRGRAARRAGT